MAGQRKHFEFDVFLSHSTKDKAVVRALAQPHHLIHVQRLQERFVEVEDRAERHRSIVRCKSRAYNRHKTP